MVSVLYRPLKVKLMKIYFLKTYLTFICAFMENGSRNTTPPRRVTMRRSGNFTKAQVCRYPSSKAPINAPHSTFPKLPGAHY